MKIIFFLVSLSACAMAEVPIYEVFEWMGLHKEFLTDFKKIGESCEGEPLNNFGIATNAFITCLDATVDVDKLAEDNANHETSINATCPHIGKLHDECIKNFIEPFKGCIEVEKHTKIDKMFKLLKWKSEYVCGLDIEYIKAVVESKSLCNWSYEAISKCDYENQIGRSALTNYMTFLSQDSEELCRAYDTNMNCFFNALCDGNETKIIEFMKTVWKEMLNFSELCIVSE